MAIPTALLAKVLGGLGVVATAATVTVIATRPKDTTEETLKALNEKIKSLGIEDTSCHLTNINTPATCTLNADALKAIKFDGKTEGASVSESASLTLKIEKGYEDLGFPEGLRFSFTNSSGSEVTIGEASNSITFKSNTTYDYKIKDNTKLEKAWVLNSINGIAGLEGCTANGGGSDITECGLRAGSVNVWRNENDYFIGGGTDPSSQKKMKVTKDSAGYRGGLKFSLDEEISLNTINSITSKTYTLSPNTNYEIDIKDIDNSKAWFLVDKTNEDLNKKIKDLGISNCKLENGATKTSECELDETKVKAINFSNKPSDASTFQVSGLDQSKKLVLVIERDYKDTDFPSGLRFTLKNTNTGTSENVTIGSSGTSQITLKPNTSYDFKIKDDTKLEKAWTIATLAEKVGLTCTDNSTECTLKAEGLSFWTSDTDYLTQLKNSETDKKIIITKDQQNYFEGLKFTVNQDITLTSTGTPTKSLQLTSSNKSYEIALKDTNKTKTWFLVEKATTPT